MPYVVPRYVCRACHREFSNYKEAVEHEKNCDKCHTCEHAYYVYGCDFNCDYSNICGYPDYKLWKEKL